jgi:hypothetical protein
MCGLAAFCNCACATADQPTNVSAAFGASVERLLGHLLPLLEADFATVTLIFVGRHSLLQKSALMI